MIAILVILTVVVFVLVEAVLRWSAPARQARRPAPATVTAFDPELQPGYFVHPGHTWVEVQRSGQVRVGVDEFARQALGRIDHVRLPRVGEHVRQGEPLMILERGARRLRLPAPVSGTVEQCRDPIVGDDELPADAWACALQPTELGDELSRLRVAGDADGWMREELRRLGEWIGQLSAPTPGAAHQDGGAPVTGFLAHLGRTACEDFERCFCQGARDLPGGKR